MSPRPLRAPLLLALVWLAGAALATGIGVLAVGLVAEQVGDPAVAPLTSEARGAGTLPSAAPASPLTTPGATTAPAAASSAPQTRTFRSVGGSAGLSCSGTTARLLYATPADGYALDERSVSGSEAEVRFEGAGTRVRLELSCAGGRPLLVDERIDERGGDDSTSED